jgi:hypothetical protein
MVMEEEGTDRWMRDMVRRVRGPKIQVATND